MSDYPERVKADHDTLCLECGTPVRAGGTILRFPDDEFFVCPRCALARAWPPPGQPVPWAARMFAELGVTLGDAAHKALAPVLHPDTGGSTEAMTALNRARDRAHGKNAAWGKASA